MQSDYRDGIYDDDDNNINGVLSTITGQVPGVIGEYAKGVLKNTIKEFYKLSTAWREFVDIGPLSDAETPYQLNPLASGSSPFVAQAIVVPTLASDELSDWALDSHGDAFIAGTLHKLHNEIGKTYTDPYKAMYYGKQWRYYINMHKIEADKNYGDAQHAWQYPRGTM